MNNRDQDQDNIIIPQELLDKKSLIQCGICIRILTSRDQAKQCASCSALFCGECIRQWNRNHNSCPHCKENPARIVEANQLILSQLQLIKWKCRNHKQGCKYNTQWSYQLEDHVKTCKYGPPQPNVMNVQNVQPVQNQIPRPPLAPVYRQCRYCGLNVNTTELSDRKTHVCFDQELKDLRRRKPEYYITRDRIPDFNSQADLKYSAACGICYELMNRPQTCKQCQRNFCQMCIANTLLKSNSCFSCRRQDPVMTDLPRNAQELLEDLKVFCKNHQYYFCGPIPYDFLFEHEDLCDERLHGSATKLRAQQEEGKISREEKKLLQQYEKEKMKRHEGMNFYLDTNYSYRYKIRDKLKALYQDDIPYFIVLLPFLLQFLLTVPLVILYFFWFQNMNQNIEANEQKGLIRSTEILFLVYLAISVFMPMGIFIWFQRQDKINTVLQKLLSASTFLIFAFPLWVFFNSYAKLTVAFKKIIIYSYFTTLLAQYLLILSFSITTFMISDLEGSAGLRKGSKTLTGFFLGYSTIMFLFAIGYHVTLYQDYKKDRVD